MIERLLLDRGINPKKVAGTHGGEFASPCPACGGKDRFRCWPAQGDGGTWYCRGCDKGGDCIEFLRFFDDLSFGEACKKLGIERKLEYSAVPKAAHKPAAFAPAQKFSAPADLWVEKAGKLLGYAEKNLLANAALLESLACRGLPLDAVKQYRLGWLLGEKDRDCYFRDRASWGLPQLPGKNGRSKPLWVPGGLVVPAFDEQGKVARLRIRREDAARARFSPDMKYVVVTGSSMHPLLLRPGARAFVVVESELDAMACAHAASKAGLDVGALAVGTNMGKPDVLAHAALVNALAILVALDFDEPGKDGSRPGFKGFAFWQDTYKQARRWPVPRGKDPGEAVSQGVDLATWLLSGLPPVFRLTGAHRPSQGDMGSECQSEKKDALTVPVGLSEKEAAPEEIEGESEGACDVSDAPDAGRSMDAPFEATPCKSADHCLYTPAGPSKVLGVLADAGLSAEKRIVDGVADYVITGHKNWPIDDKLAVFAWLRKYGDWVYDALYGVENEN